MDADGSTTTATTAQTVALSSLESVHAISTASSDTTDSTPSNDPADKSNGEAPHIEDKHGGEVRGGTKKSSGPRYLRANYILGRTIPPSLALLLFSGYRLIVFQVGPFVALTLGYGWTFTVTWLGVCHLILLSMLYNYFKIFLLPNDHSSVPSEIPESIKERRIVYECQDEEGTPAQCWLDECNGRWRPTRARHCRDCGVCRLAWDHCCPWFGTCITLTLTLKPFILFICHVPPLIILACVPLVRVLRDHLNEVLEVGWYVGEGTEVGRYMREVWWDRWYSWCLGPVWRYLGGLFLIYIKYPLLSTLPPHPPTGRAPLYKLQTHYIRDPTTRSLYSYEHDPHRRLTTPHLAPLVVGFLVFGVAVVAVFIGWITVCNLAEGRLTVEVEGGRRVRGMRRAKGSGKGGEGGWDPRVRLWIPFEDDQGEEVKVGKKGKKVDGKNKGKDGEASRGRKGKRRDGGTVYFMPDDRIFDLGPWGNWRRAMGFKWWHWLVPGIPSPTDGIEWPIRPERLRELREEVRRKVS